jgi:hypothetical protein
MGQVINIASYQNLGFDEANQASSADAKSRRALWPTLFVFKADQFRG